MLSVRALDIYGKSTHLGAPLSLSLSKDINVPADIVKLSLEGTGFAYLKSIELLKDGEVFFSGEVDEQIEKICEKPCSELVARSSAALLIDSEAYPMSFVNPSAKDIFEHYAKPFGFTLKGESKELKGSFTVAKGTSCFAAIKAFSREAYGTLPRCEGDVLYIDGLKENGRLNLGEGGVPFERLSLSRLRCNRISKVMVKLKDGEGYKSAVVNKKAEAEGINRVRYLNAALKSATPLSRVDEIFAQGENESFMAEALCRGFIADALGKSVKLKGVEEELYVSALKATLSKSGEFTRLTLKRKEK